MDALGWIVAIIVFLLVGKHLNLTAALPLNAPNAVPTVNDSLPVISSQDNTNSPACQPAPWRSPCNPTGQATVMSIASSPMPVAQQLPTINPVQGTAIPSTQPLPRVQASTARTSFTPIARPVVGKLSTY